LEQSVVVLHLECRCFRNVNQSVTHNVLVHDIILYEFVGEVKRS
jgi:hypothetical protein